MPIFPLYGPAPATNFIMPSASGSPAGGGAGSASTLTGAPPVGYDPAYGGIPQVPNLIDIYGQTLGANQRFLPQLTTLGSQVTGATEQELLNNLRLAIPGYDASVAQSMSNIGALQRGQIPTDVTNLIKQQAAERGIATGLYDSPNANAALLRALGLTSLGLQGEGEKQMTSLVGRTPQAKPFDISTLMMSPTDLYEANLLANIYRAAPQPRAAANQMIGQQLGAYDIGRRNIPSYSLLQPDYGAPYTPIARDQPNPPSLGALGPFSQIPPIAPFNYDYPINWSDVGPPEYGPPGYNDFEDLAAEYFPEMYGELPQPAQPGLMDWVSDFVL